MGKIVISIVVIYRVLFPTDFACLFSGFILRNIQCPFQNITNTQKLDHLTIGLLFSGGGGGLSDVLGIFFLINIKCQWDFITKIRT